MTNIKINYQNVTNRKGYVHRKGITINNKLLEEFYSKLIARISKLKNKANKRGIWDGDDYTEHMFLSTPIERISNIAFLNLTQARLFEEFILSLSDITINKKRLAYDANTYLIIKN